MRPPGNREPYVSQSSAFARGTLNQHECGGGTVSSEVASSGRRASRARFEPLDLQDSCAHARASIAVSLLLLLLATSAAATQAALEVYQ